MSSICKQCIQTITKKSPGVICGDCYVPYHANGRCSDINKSQLSAIKNLPGTGWKCISCRILSSSPNRTSVSHATIIDDASEDEHIGAGLSTSVASLTSEIKNLKRTVEFCSDKITDFEDKLNKFNDVISRMNKLEKENAALRREVSGLQVRVNVMEQQSRSSNLEIQNVPESSNENLVNIVSGIGSHIGVPIDSSSLNYVTRVPTKIANKPKNIIVRFVSKIKRDDFLAACRSMRRSNTNPLKGLRVDGVADEIFVNEHLTIQNKILFKETRTVARSKGYSFVWTQNGNILVRKDQTSKIIQIVELSGLNEL